MANATLFRKLAGKLIPKTDARNFENAPAYAFSAKHALAQYAATGCLNNTFYADAELQLEDVLELCSKVEPEFIARTAIFARRHSYMKDVPALLCAALSVRDLRLHEQVFEQVLDNLKMLRTYVQILRSGVVGRKSLGSGPKRLVVRWLETREEDQLFRASPGSNPSLADILKMTHPKPANLVREAFYGYMIGRAYDTAALPSLVREFERFKSGEQLDVPDLPFTMLSALPLSWRDWGAKQLRVMVGVSRHTLERWRQWWLEEFPRSSFWRWASGQMATPVDEPTLPLSLLESFRKPRAEERTVDLLRFILPLTTTPTMQETGGSRSTRRGCGSIPGVGL